MPSKKAGVELAGGIAERIDEVLRRDLPWLDLRGARVTVVGRGAEGPGDLRAGTAPRSRAHAASARSRSAPRGNCRDRGWPRRHARRWIADRGRHRRPCCGSRRCSACDRAPWGHERSTPYRCPTHPAGAGHPAVFAVGDVAARSGGTAVPCLSSAGGAPVGSPCGADDHPKGAREDAGSTSERARTCTEAHRDRGTAADAAPPRIGSGRLFPFGDVAATAWANQRGTTGQPGREHALQRLCALM